MLRREERRECFSRRHPRGSHPGKSSGNFSSEQTTWYGPVAPGPGPDQDEHKTPGTGGGTQVGSRSPAATSPLARRAGLRAGGSREGAPTPPSGRLFVSSPAQGQGLRECLRHQRAWKPGRRKPMSWRCDVPGPRRATRGRRAAPSCTPARTEPPARPIHRRPWPSYRSFSLSQRTLLSNEGRPDAGERPQPIGPEPLAPRVPSPGAERWTSRAHPAPPEPPCASRDSVLDCVPLRNVHPRKVSRVRYHRFVA